MGHCSSQSGRQPERKGASRCLLLWRAVAIWGTRSLIKKSELGSHLLEPERNLTQICKSKKGKILGSYNWEVSRTHLPLILSVLVVFVLASFVGHLSLTLAALADTSPQSW